MKVTHSLPQCGVCSGQMGDTSTGTDVRIRNGHLTCNECYIATRGETNTSSTHVQTHTHTHTHTHTRITRLHTYYTCEHAGTHTHTHTHTHAYTYFHHLIRPLYMHKCIEKCLYCCRWRSAHNTMRTMILCSRPTLPPSLTDRQIFRLLWCDPFPSRTGYQGGLINNISALGRGVYWFVILWTAQTM